MLYYKTMTKEEVASYIDHTLLSPDAGVKEIAQLCTEAIKYKFKSVCVNPVYISYAVFALAQTDIKVCTVIGFPFGAANPEVKAFEACDAIRNGADEVDMVINIGAAIDGRISLVGSDIAIVVKAAREEAAKLGRTVVIKAIMETCFLDDDTLKLCCQTAKKAGADFVKTSTGFSTGGATVHDVELMRKTVGEEMGVKASGGVRTHEDLLAMVEAGANRIGTSNGTKII